MTPFVFRQWADRAPNQFQKLIAGFKPIYFKNIYSNNFFWREFLKIADAFRQHGLSIVPLKGIDMLARFHTLFDQRTLSDIDVLIKENDLDKVEPIFFSLGYKKNLEGLRENYWREHQCHLVFQSDRIRVDAHFGLDFKRKNRVLLPRLWDRTEEAAAGGATVRLLSAEDALFAFALHWRRFGNILSLKQVIDAAHLIQGSSRLDWDYILEESARGRMRATTYFLLLQVSLFCGSKVPEEVFKKLDVPFWKRALIKKLILKYTFDVGVPLKKLFLRAHFLLYDGFWEPVLYLINIPYEQFCKFYRLTPYTRAADLRYRLRILYMALSVFMKITDI
ncbi:MAG: nucleotidyltransferase family protein [Candidatus Omnitrophica bacterium]|nr:nucleotidyltransferase family protein [Candidatus Omnitrophota bacterium]